MALTEFVDEIYTVLPDGQIQVLQVTHVLRDGVEIARSNHRFVRAPGDDMTNTDVRLQAITSVLWTDAVITAYQAAKAAAEAAAVAKHGMLQPATLVP